MSDSWASTCTEFDSKPACHSQGGPKGLSPKRRKPGFGAEASLAVSDRDSWRGPTHSYNLRRKN